MVSIFDPKKLTLALGDEIVTGFTEDFHITYDSNLNNLSFTLLGNSPYSFNLGDVYRVGINYTADNEFRNLLKASGLVKLDNKVISFGGDVFPKVTYHFVKHN